MKEILEDLKNKVETAKQELDKLEQLISLAEEAGEDVTEYKIQHRQLSKRVENWSRAIENRLKNY